MTVLSPLGRIAVLVGLTTLTTAASAQSAPDSSSTSSSAAVDAALAEVKAAKDQAARLAKQGKHAEAAVLQDRAIELLMTKVGGLMGGADNRTKAMLVVAVSEEQLAAAVYHGSAGNFGTAADRLESAIAMNEKLGNMSTHKGDIDEWKTAAREMRKRAAQKSGSSSSSPSRSAPATSSGSPQADIRRAAELNGSGKAGEAVVLLDTALPKLESSTTDRKVLREANATAAKIYDDALRHSKAEACYVRLVALVEIEEGRQSKNLVSALKDLGYHYLNRDEHERAAPHFMRAYDIAVAIAPEKRAELIMGLARVVNERKDHREAALLLGKARSLLAEGDVMYMIAGVQLAAVLEELDRFQEAERIYDETRAQLEPMYKQSPELVRPMWAALVSALGWHYRKRGEFAKAEVYSREALELKKKTFGNDSLVAANADCNLGEVYWASGDLERSLEPIGRCFDEREKNISRVIASGSEEQKRAYVGSFLIAYEKTLTAQIRAKNGSPRLNRLAMNQVLRTKGRILDAMTGQSETIRRSATAETKSLLDRLATTRTMLATLSSSGQAADRIKQLEEESRRIEVQLSEKSEAYRQATKEVSVSTVRSAIPSGAVLIEIVAFHPLDPLYRKLSDQEEQRYIAYILHGDGGAEPTAVDLGASAPIDAQVEALRKAVSSPEVAAQDAGANLYESLIRPLEPHLRGKTHLIVSPDGALNTVPFTAMRKNNEWLVSSYTFTYVTSGRDLLRWGASAGGSKGMLVVANPDFAMNGSSSGSSSVLGRVKFPPLPGTETEARAIGSLFPHATVVTQKDASEARVKKLEHPRILHLATHGFFLGATRVGVGDQRGLELDEGEVRKTVRLADNPLLRSGLALAGASALQGNEGEDGILTALEAASLDLTGTKLVVLSACQTAQGEARNGEGVYGLRRALSMAGAETLLMSLWSVDDEATSFLMKSYYDRLKAGRGRSEALRDVQIEMTKSKAVSHPYFWAAFIPSGDPSKMDMSDVDLALGSEKKPGQDRPVRPAPETNEEPLKLQAGWDLGINYLTTTNLRDQTDRAGLLVNVKIETPLLSRYLHGKHFGLHDAMILAGLVGGRTSDAVKYGNGEEEGALSVGFRSGYEAALGVRGSSVGLYAGGQAMYSTFILGDVRTYGTTLPLIALLNLRAGETDFLLRGSYGTWLVDQETVGASLSMRFDSYFLLAGIEEMKLPSSVSLDGDELRASAARQVTTMATFAIGGNL